MKNTIARLNTGVALLILLAGTAMNSQAVTFSLDPFGPFPATPDDILIDPGAAAPTPAGILIPGGAVGNTDAFSYGEFGAVDLTTIFFSVSPGSFGAAGTAVAIESLGAGGGPGDHPADVFSSVGAGGNLQVWDGNGFANPGVALNMGLTEPIAAGPFDNVDGLDLALPAGTIFWSVDPATAAGAPPYAGFGAADIFTGASGPGYAAAPGIYVTALGIGLAPGDDIDALEIIEDGVAGFSFLGDTVIFSLAPGSPTLVGLGASAADVFGVGAGIGPAPVVVAPFFALGLAPGDDIDGLDLIPEPSRAMLLLLGVVGMTLRRRR